MDIIKGVMLSIAVISSTPKTIESVAPDGITPALEITDVRELVDFYADHYNVSSDVMHKVVNCESSYNPNAVGDNGNSFGLSQIHLPSWGGQITKEEALDPNFALNFLAEKLSEGRGNLWTCYRMFY